MVVYNENVVINAPYTLSVGGNMSTNAIVECREYMEHMSKGTFIGRLNNHTFTPNDYIKFWDKYEYNGEHRSVKLHSVLVDGDPYIICEQGMGIEKDIVAKGMFNSLEGEIALNGGSYGPGWAPYTRMPFIWLAQSGYDTFEIRKSVASGGDWDYNHTAQVWGWGNIEAGTLTAHGDVSLISGGDLKASFKYIPGNGTSVITCEHNNLVIQCLGGDGTYGDVVLYPAVNSCVVVWGGRWIVPQNANTGMVGNHSNRYFYEGAFYNSYGHSAGYFDAYDDLAIVKQWGEPNPTLPDDYDSCKTKPKSRNPFAILKGSTEEKESDDSELYNFGKMNSFALGCAKALAKKLDQDEATLLEMFNKIETQQNEIDTLRSQIQQLTSTRGVNA